MTNNFKDKERFWLYDPTILFDSEDIFNVLPLPNLNDTQKLNAITRMIIILSLVGFTFNRNPTILISAAISLAVIVIVYKIQVKRDMNDLLKKSIREGFASKNDFVDILSSNYQQPSKNNPFMNVLMTDYKDNAKRSAAAPAYNKNIQKDIQDKTKLFNEDISKKLYNNLGDNLSFEHMMRNFYSMPNTQIPNAQEKFAEFCYGDMKSCKDGESCLKNMRRVGTVTY